MRSVVVAFSQFPLPHSPRWWHSCPWSFRKSTWGWGLRLSSTRTAATRRMQLPVSPDVEVLLFAPGIYYLPLFFYTCRCLTRSRDFYPFPSTFYFALQPYPWPYNFPFFFCFHLVFFGFSLFLALPSPFSSLSSLFLSYNIVPSKPFPCLLSSPGSYLDAYSYPYLPTFTLRLARYRVFLTCFCFPWTYAPFVHNASGQAVTYQ